MRVRNLLVIFSCLALLAHAAIANPPVIFPGDTAQSLKLVWPATPGLRYTVQQSTNLQSWTTAPGYPAVANGPAQQMIFPTTNNTAFYRVSELDDQPPAIVSQYPVDGGFAVPRFSNLSFQLSDATGINTNSIGLTVGSLGTFTFPNAQLTFSNNLLTFINGGSIPLGSWGSNVVLTLVMADTLGHAITNTMTFSLEVQPQVVTNLFVFGSPQAQRAGQQIGNIPTRALAEKFGPVPMGAGDPWTLELVESNRMELSYTNTAPGFATNTYVCNLTPARPEEIFNRKITSISDDPGNKRLTLFTVEVPLSELATNASVTISGDSRLIETGTNGAFVQMLSIDRTIQFPRIGYSLDGAAFSLKDTSGFTVASLTLEEEHWWLTPSLQVGMEIHWGELKRFEAIARGNIQSASIWNVDFLLAGVTYETTLFELSEAQKLKLKKWMLLGYAGPVPVFASLGFNVSLKGRAEVNSTVSFRAGKRETTDAAFGVTYQKPAAPQWVQSFIFTPPVVEPFTANINAEGSVKVSLEPAVEFLVYGLAGVSAGITPSAGVVFKVGTGEPLSGRLEAEVSLDLGTAGPAFDRLGYNIEFSAPLWSDQWHLFPKESIRFTLQPQSQTVPVGRAAYFSCSVTSTNPPAYQWYFNSVPLPGQTARTLAIPYIRYGDAGNYQVQVSAGGRTTNSAIAQLTVISTNYPPPALTIKTQPQSQTVSAGSSVSFSVDAAAPSPIAYQWYFNSVPIPGETAPTLLLSAVLANFSGNYQVRLLAGTQTTNSAIARLTVISTNIPTGMALIPAGSFTMGDSLDGNELPMHSVYVSAFYMDKYDVTYSLWQTVYNWAIAHGYSFDLAGAGKAADHPVQTINWYDCVKWCNARSEMEGRVPAYYTSAAQTTVYRTGAVSVDNGSVKWNSGYRLPTEAEWEKAARGGASGRRFPWGNTISWSQANYYASPSDYSYDVNPTSGYHPTFATGSFPYTSPVNYFAPNGYGLYDMAGNVWQWCWDWYGSYGSASQTDPRGPTSGSSRVFRGGGCYDLAISCRAAFRYGSRPGYGYDGIGFRSVLSPGQ